MLWIVFVKFKWCDFWMTNNQADKNSIKQIRERNSQVERILIAAENYYSIVCSMLNWEMRHISHKSTHFVTRCDNQRWLIITVNITSNIRIHVWPQLTASSICLTFIFKCLKAYGWKTSRFNRNNTMNAVALKCNSFVEIFTCLIGA